MRNAIISLCGLAFLCLMFIVIKDIRPNLIYKEQDGNYSIAQLYTRGSLSSLTVSWWTEKKLAKLLYQAPTPDGDEYPFQTELVNSFTTQAAARAFYGELRKVDFQSSVFSNALHAFFSPITETIHVADINKKYWLMQTRGLITYRSSREESTIQVIVQMTVGIDPGNGTLKFISGEIKEELL